MELPEWDESAEDCFTEMEERAFAEAGGIHSSNKYERPIGVLVELCKQMKKQLTDKYLLFTVIAVVLIILATYSNMYKHNPGRTLLHTSYLVFGLPYSFARLIILPLSLLTHELHVISLGLQHMQCNAIVHICQQYPANDTCAALCAH